MDLKDKKILYQLDIDCRQSNAQIGRKVGLSKQVVEYRIKRMQKQGIISHFATVVDTYKLGYSKYKVYFSLQGANKQVINNMISFLKKHPKTEWVARCSGRWDIIVGFLVKNVYEFNKALSSFNELFSPYIAAKETSISLEVPHWRKKYLLKAKQRIPAVVQGGKQSAILLDEIDEKLLRLLVNNARMSIVELAQRMKSTPRVVQDRLVKLKRKEIIILQRVFLDLNSINWVFCKGMFRFKHLTQKKYNMFLSYCDSLENLTYMIKNVGSWDIELDFEIESFSKFNEIMLQIREKFSSIIKQYDFVIVMQENKLDYYPHASPILQ